MIAVVFALEFEAADFTVSAARRLCVDEWILGVTGSRAAAALERRLDASRPSLVISAGFCGALDSGLALGEVVVGENFTTPGLLSVLEGTPSIRRGTLVTVPDVLSTHEEKTRLAAESGAIIADMETSHLEALCRARGIAFFSLRAVSDVAGEDLPVPGDVLIAPETGRPAPERLFRYLLKNPGGAVGLNRLIRNAKEARKNVSSALHTLIPALLRTVPL